MIENLFSFPIIILYALLYGITMKVADLLNEHNLKWFKGSAIIFGFLWGIFGALLVLSDNIIANIMLAMNLAFIIKKIPTNPHPEGCGIFLSGFLNLKKASSMT